eukprot:CAMPEP_0176504874 /NCGR_PEP_ID=MMETSP0200_2-20121128/16185_1 /TAXON_ID=947934 /ORGANISM="Chaetoceros sp., Strain GSL56" /LENGTH=588 /DNA_ID=CAMNT_0017904373 /DNA_START=2046 /DNA_END=3812 /DNA_ORIENTATION=+
MSPPFLSRDTATVLKLKILDEGIRRIPLSNIWDVYGVSYSRLLDLVLRYSSSLEKADAHRIIVTYTDEDGDIITISSDQELEDAFLQFVDKVPSVVRATVSVTSSSLCKEEVASTQQTMDEPQQETGSRVSVSNHVVLLEERVSRLEDKVAKILMQVHDHGKDETVCAKEVATKAVQVKPKVISKATGTNHPEGTKQSKDETGSKAIKNTKETVGLECFHPDFIHGRHTCDGCFTTPIVGYRFHAVNLPDYDLCHKCFKNYKGSDVFFQPEELERDRQLQSRWRTRVCKKTIQGCAPVPARKCNKGFHVKKVKEIAQDVYDAALNEAIRRSLIVEQKKEETAGAVETPNDDVKEEAELLMTVENTPRAQKVPEKVEVEDVTSQCEKEEDDDQVDAELLFPVAPTHCPEDVPKQPVDPLSMEIETLGSDNVPNDDNSSSEKETRKKGNDLEEDVKSTCSSETNDWQVVDENGQNTDYNMVAHAAQLIGSSLFQSDMASDDHHGNVRSSDSVTSGLTSIPSLKSKSEISSVLLSRWESELRQLHEFGFVDDHANVEALGHLEAANIGVDSDDPITINAVVDYLLKHKKMD